MKRRSSTLLRGLLVGCGLTCLATPAEAHLVTTGLGPVYDGMSHMLLSPDDWCVVLGLALLAGLGGAETVRRVLLVLPCAWFLGVLSGRAVMTEPSITLAPFTLMIIGVSVAAGLRLRARAAGIVAGVAGTLHGGLDGAALAVNGGSGLPAVGMAITAFIIVALVSGVVVPLKAGWQRIGVRVLGSWLAAAGLLMLGWSLRR